MTDEELAAQLRSVRVPPRTPEYWENFPQTVRSQLRSSHVVRESPGRFLPRFAWAGGLAYACLLCVLMAGPAHCLLKTEQSVRRELAQVPAQLKSFMADEHGLHYLVVEKE